MADIRILQDVDTGEDFYPATHEEAIVDDDGNKVIEKLKSDLSNLKELNSVNILDYENRIDTTFNGISYKWNNGKLHISGTATAYSFYNFIAYADIVPSYLKLGHTYNIKCSIPENLQFRFMFYRNHTTDDAEIKDFYFDTETSITIPTDITGICIRLGVTGGISIDTDIEVAVYNAPTNGKLWENIQNVQKELLTDISNLIDYNSVDILAYAEKVTKTVNGIKYEWENNDCHISGTATAYSFYNLIAYADTIPSWLRLGETYNIKCSIPANVQFRFLYYRNYTTDNPEIIDFYFDTDTTITLPTDITGICIRIGVTGGISVDSVLKLSVKNAPTNKELAKKINNLETKKLHEPIITFIDDDGVLDGLLNWEDVADRTGIKPSFVLITNYMGREVAGKQWASWDVVERLTGKGFEFMSHTHNHINLANTDLDTIENDFAESQKLLREHGCNAHFMAYPFGVVPSSDTEKMSLIKHYFNGAIGFGWAVNTPPLNTFNIARETVVDTNKEKVDKTFDGVTTSFYAWHDFAWFKSTIDDAIKNGSWVIFTTHLRNDIDTNGIGTYYCDEEIKELLVNVCKYASSNGVKILPFGEAYNIYKNRLEIGNITDDSFYIVDCNGNIHEK